MQNPAATRLCCATANSASRRSDGAGSATRKRHLVSRTRHSRQDEAGEQKAALPKQASGCRPHDALTMSPASPRSDDYSREFRPTTAPSPPESHEFQNVRLQRREYDVRKMIRTGQAVDRPARLHRIAEPIVLARRIATTLHAILPVGVRDTLGKVTARAQRASPQLNIHLALHAAPRYTNMAQHNTPGNTPDGVKVYGTW